MTNSMKLNKVTSDSLLEKSQIKEESITLVALSENISHLVHTVHNGSINIGVPNTDQKRGYSVRSLLSCFKYKS